KEEFLHRILNELLEKEGNYPASVVLEKLASMSCKAAIKGNQRISEMEMGNLMKQLMKLENPYNCPHGRPVFIRITKTELEKKFKRIV
nr:DNA mismatch repair protein MutL [Lachnospiraceae bacterium]